MLNLENYLKIRSNDHIEFIAKNYHRIGLQSEEFLFILQIHMAQLEGDSFPDLQMIALNMGVKQDRIYQLLNRLVSNGFINIKTKTIDGKRKWIAMTFIRYMMFWEIFGKTKP